jgi:hypothetical protein
MTDKAREFIDFWIETSVHTVDRGDGTSQDLADLTQRCVAMAAAQGITEDAMREEIGDIAEYILSN